MLTALLFVFFQTQPPFDAQLRANAHAFSIVDGRLAGDGAALIESATRDVQFVAMGEEHNRRAMHRFAGALFAYLAHNQGFGYLALEEDPYLGRLLSQAARSGGSDAVMRLALRYPNAFHMYTEEELHFIADAARTSNAPHDPIWGLNQIFGAMHVYDRLVEIAPDANARGVAQKLFEEARQYEGERFEKNVHYIESVAKPEDFERLRAAFHPRAGSEAELLIGQMALSNRIFAPYVTTPRPPSSAFIESGATRERNMKLLFADDYRRAGVAQPKVMVMFGQLHLYRGLTERTHIYTLGNYLSEVATFNGSRSLNIYGTINAPFEMKSKRAPLARAALDVIGNADGVVIDLRPLFDVAVHDMTLDPELRELVRSFDLFVFMRDGEQGSSERLKTPHFHWYPE
jgi:GNAT superfamily N-acetyltransferase